MEELLEVLKGIKPEIDFENEENLIDDEFDVKITAKDIVPENFNSAEALYELIQRLEEE